MASAEPANQRGPSRYFERVAVDAGVQDGLETHYISATPGVYLSLYNVFQSLLALLRLRSGREEWRA